MKDEPENIVQWLWDRHWENVLKAVAKYPPYGSKIQYEKSQREKDEASFEKHPYWEEHND